MKPKVSWFIENGMPIKGVIHAGAGDGEEVPGYKELGIKNILCFEPLKKAYDILETYADGDIITTMHGLSDTTHTAVLNVSAGDGKGSSLLQVIKDHPEVVEKWNHGQADIVGQETISLYRLDDWFEERVWANPELYDCLVLDTQGNEYEVINGCGELIYNFDYLMVELSETPVYKGEHSAEEVCKQLEEFGFERLTSIFPHDDVMFRRVG